MKPRVLIALSLVLASINVRANDVDECNKISGEASIAACTRIIESGARQGAELASVYSVRGVARQRHGDPQGAWADYSRALELDPRNVYALNNRASAKLRRDDVEGAIADYTLVLEIDPKFTLSHINRGNARRRKGDYDGAIADLNRAVELDPRSANAYTSRGNVHLVRGDLDRAIADYDRALEIDPRYARGYRHRGHARYFKGEFKGAGDDFARSQEFKASDHDSLWRYLARSRAGGDGKGELGASAAKLDPAKWPAPLAAFFLGKATAESVRKQAEDPDPKIRKERLCEASYYVGQWQLLKNERERAIESMQSARNQCPKEAVEQSAAVYELKRLGVR